MAPPATAASLAATLGGSTTAAATGVLVGDHASGTPVTGDHSRRIDDLRPSEQDRSCSPVQV